MFITIHIFCIIMHQILLYYVATGTHYHGSFLST